MSADRIALLDALKSRTILVPALWHFELANALVQGERRGRIDQAAIVTFNGLVRDLRIRTDHGLDDDGPLVLFLLARQHGLTAYDAAYLELATRVRAPLATLDRALRTAANTVGLGVVPE